MALDLSKLASVVKTVASATKSSSSKTSTSSTKKVTKASSSKTNFIKWFFRFDYIIVERCAFSR